MDLLQLLALKLCGFNACILLDVPDVLLRVQLEAGTPCDFSQDARRTIVHAVCGRKMNNWRFDSAPGGILRQDRKRGPRVLWVDVNVVILARLVNVAICAQVYSDTI